MTGKLTKQPVSSTQYNKYEADTEKLRNENKWLKLHEYASVMSIKDQKTEILSKFCIAESELENYLFINPLLFPSNLNTESSSMIGHVPLNAAGGQIASILIKNTDTLFQVEQILKDVIVKSEKNSQNIEASMLLSKLYYSQMRFEDAIKQLNTSKVQSIMNEHLTKLKQNQENSQYIPRAETLRQFQIFAEAHSIRGLCLERKRFNNLSTNPNFKQSDECKQEEQDIIDSFELASLIAIHHSVLMHQYFNSQTSNASGANNAGNFSSSGNIASNASNLESVITSATAAASLTLNALNNMDDNLDLINPLYEIALQKAPLLYIKKGDLQMGIRKFRELLLKKHIQSITSIRQVLLKKFAECLMFNVSPSQYSVLRKSTTTDKLKPIFKPVNQDEEILLCLVLSQYLASKEVMLLRQAQFKQLRQHTLNNAINSLDLLLFYLGYHRSYNVLIDKFEMTMKYSFEQFYVWFQYGLTLICDQKYYRAYLVLKECIRMKPEHVTCYLLLAKLAIENLFFVDEAIEWCMKILEMTSNRNLKAHILLGCSMCIKAKLQKQHASQINFYEKALESFKKANSLDQGDYLPLYHIAHCYSILRQINESLEYVQKALKLKPDDKDSMHLLSLLLTSTKNYDEAYTIINKACAIYDDYELMYTKIRIEEILFGFDQSVKSIINLVFLYKQTLQSSKEKHGSTCSSSVVSAAQQGIPNVFKNGAQFTNQNIENWSSFESASMLNLQHTYKLNEAMGKTITMLLQSDQLSFKYGNSIAQSQNLQQLLILVRILTQVGEFYLRHDKLNDAEMCCQEIALNHPMSYLHLYLRGRIFEYKQDYSQAKLCYQNALSINPHHIQSLQQMAYVLCHMQNFHLAEKMIRDAISLNSSLPDSWQILARVLDYQNDNQSAMKCYQTCLQLEATNPILPFSSLTRIL